MLSHTRTLVRGTRSRKREAKEDGGKWERGGREREEERGGKRERESWVFIDLEVPCSG